MCRSPAREPAHVLLNGTLSQSQTEIYNKYSINFTTTSLKKIRQYYQPENSRSWDIKFVSSRRRDGGGVVGIFLHRDPERDGVYVRWHFPSLVETTSVETVLSRKVGECCNIEIEADTLRTCQTFAAQKEIKIRVINLCEYGLVDHNGRVGVTKNDSTLFWDQIWISLDIRYRSNSQIRPAHKARASIGSV